jgi:hypothetical protein
VLYDTRYGYRINSTFDLRYELQEDIYTLADGMPWRDPIPMHDLFSTHRMQVIGVFPSLNDDAR